MATVQIPGIDQTICAEWSEVDRDFYNKLPIYFVEAQSEARQDWSVIRRLLGTTPWSPNKGDTQKAIMNERGPVLRQNATPNLLSVPAKKDVHITRERSTTMKLHWQKFETPTFNFLPDFEDFMVSHIKPNTDNLNRQISIFEDQFYETVIWNQSPAVYVCGYGLVDGAPQGDTEATGKTAGFVGEQLLANVPANESGFLSFSELWKALIVFEEELGATPYEGSGLPDGDSSPLDERFCLVCSSEDWLNFTNDPWLKENRPLNMDIVTNKFRGDLFGKLRTKLWKYPRRIKSTADFVPSYPAPETVELNEDRDDFGRTKPNPEYSKISETINDAQVGSQFGVAYLFGGKGYKRAEGLNPPGQFKNGVEFKGMDWSGRARLTDNILIQCGEDDAGNPLWETNKYGEQLQLISTLAMGIRGDNKFNVLPIVFKRHRGITTVLGSE